jgi:DNA-binding PadR family transcriptional regulator
MKKASQSKAQALVDAIREEMGGIDEKAIVPEIQRLQKDALERDIFKAERDRLNGSVRRMAQAFLVEQKAQYYLQITAEQRDYLQRVLEGADTQIEDFRTEIDRLRKMLKSPVDKAQNREQVSKKRVRHA